MKHKVMPIRPLDIPKVRKIVNIGYQKSSRWETYIQDLMYTDLAKSREPLQKYRDIRFTLKRMIGKEVYEL